MARKKTTQVSEDELAAKVEEHRNEYEITIEPTDLSDSWRAYVAKKDSRKSWARRSDAVATIEKAKTLSESVLAAAVADDHKLVVLVS